MKNTVEQFINAILDTKTVWLLQAREGFFAMLEDNRGNSYIPLWESEESASKAAQGDWESYNTASMGFSELAHWLGELVKDEINIAVAPEADGKITAISSDRLRVWLKPYDDHTYHEEDDEEMPDGGSVSSKYGPDDKPFDYGEGWAEKWS